MIYESELDREVRKAGINVVFPGPTEFMDRYTKPTDLPHSPYQINPQPDFTLPGRPLARLVPDSFQSEYTRRYISFHHDFFVLFSQILARILLLAISFLIRQKWKNFHGFVPGKKKSTNICSLSLSMAFLFFYTYSYLEENKHIIFQMPQLNDRASIDFVGSLLPILDYHPLRLEERKNG